MNNCMIFCLAAIYITTPSFLFRQPERLDYDGEVEKALYALGHGAVENAQASSTLPR
jgi:hypothetical protein